MVALVMKVALNCVLIMNGVQYVMTDLARLMLLLYAGNLVTQT